MTKEQQHEERDKTNPIQTFSGTVKHLSHPSYEHGGAYYLFTEDGNRYDLPMKLERPDGSTTSMKEYLDKYVVVTARHFVKTIGEKTYDKLLVIFIAW